MSRDEAVREIMRREVESARARGQGVGLGGADDTVRSMGQAILNLATVCEMLLDQTKPRQVVEVNGRRIERSPYCTGCTSFPNALCGPCHRWNHGGS